MTSRRAIASQRCVPEIEWHGRQKIVKYVLAVAILLRLSHLRIFADHKEQACVGLQLHLCSPLSDGQLPDWSTLSTGVKSGPSHIQRRLCRPEIRASRPHKVADRSLVRHAIEGVRNWMERAGQKGKESIHNISQPAEVYMRGNVAPTSMRSNTALLLITKICCPYRRHTSLQSLQEAAGLVGGAGPAVAASSSSLTL